MKLFEAIIKRLRTDPFRTKLEPDFKMEWGIERKEEPYPSRIKQEVEVFDLKSFVTEEKNKRIAESKSNERDIPNPFRPINNNTFDNFANTPMNNNMNSTARNSMRNDFNAIDFDYMLKDLSEKFKELDREEEEKKKKQNTNFGNSSEIELPKKKEEVKDNKFFMNPFESNIPKTENIKSDNDYSLASFKKEIEAKTNDEPMVRKEKIEENNKPKINVDESSKVISDNIISDDEFFDDFFGDDE